MLRSLGCTKLTRYLRIAELLCEKVNANYEITGNIQEFTSDKKYAFYLGGPCYADVNYDALGPLTIIYLKADAEKHLLQIKSELLALKKAMLDDPYTQ